MRSTVKLGRSNLDISRVGFGCMQLSAFYPPFPSEEEGIKVIQAALEDGVNFLDTSDVYGPHTNEVLIGKALKNVPREKYVIATKFGIRIANGVMEICGEPQYVKQCCYASLERLQMDYIDLYYAHRIDKNVPIEDTMRALVELVNEGKIKHIGLSECSVETLRKAHAVHPIAAVQYEYSLFYTGAENGLLEACRELGVTFVAYSPLGRGFLTGKYKSIDDLDPTDFRRHIPRFTGANWDKNLNLVNEVKKLADQKGCTISQIALSWILHQGSHIVLIPGTKSIKYLKENDYSDQIHLNQHDLAKLREILSTFPPEGDRYNSYMMSYADI